jgi:hypothetical protein
MPDPQLDEVGVLEIPRFQLGERIGAGGFGEVYLAHHTLMDRDVAIKILHAKYSSDPDAIARFIAEARAVAKISHPNIVDVFDFGQLPDGRHYCVMELIRGTTLRDILRERTRLGVDEALPLLRGIAEAIDAAHTAGVAHRDIKPDNVFVLDGGGVKLIDFGLAKLTRDDPAATPVTQTGAVLGTPLYMSPEQCRGKSVGLATDAYSFGALAYHALVGEPPFSGEALELALHHLHDPPPLPSSRRPDLTARVDRVLLSLLAKAPSARPRSLAVAVDALVGKSIPKRRTRVVAWLAAATIVGGSIAFGVARARVGREAGVAYVRRALPITLIDGIGAMPKLSADGTTLYYDDKSGSWKLDLASRAVTQLDFGAYEHVRPLADGRLLLQSKNPEGQPHVEMATADGQTLRRLFEGENAVGSPDGTLIAAIQDRWLVVYEVASATTRRLCDLARYNQIGDPTWSRDGRTLVWASNVREPATKRLHATRVSDGATQIIGVPVLADTTVIQPVDFSSDGRLVYCGEDEGGSSVRMREIDDESGTTERVLATLDRGVSGCSVSVSPADRIVVTLMFSRPTVATLDLAAPGRELRALGPVGESLVVSDVDGDVSHVFAYSRGRLAAGVYPFVARGEPDLHRLSVGGGADASLVSCRGDVGVVRLGAAMLHVELDASPTRTTVRLRSAACEPVHEWGLPDGTWSMPRCRATFCVIARKTEGAVAMWKLDVDSNRATELARWDEDLPIFSPQFGISPDGTKVVVLISQDSVLRVISTIDGQVTPMPLREGFLQSVAWTNDPDHFVGAGMNLLGRGGDDYAVVRFGLDGSRQPMWSSQATWFGVIVASSESSTIAGDARFQRNEFIVLDPAD